MSERQGIRVLHLFDEYLNIYADRGNMMVLKKRCEWRDLDCTIDGFGLDDELDPEAYDLIYVGGGQDRDQRMIAERMAGDVGEALRAAAQARVVILGVCGGYQLLGHYYRDADGVEQPGSAVLDLTTEAGPTRLIGNIEIECSGLYDLRSIRITGFENHAGRTTLGKGTWPLGKVIHGHGNDGESGIEGCRQDRIVGTYLHGPLLPGNPEFADWVIASALATRYGADAPMLAEIGERTGGHDQRARDVLSSRAAAEHR